MKRITRTMALACAMVISMNQVAFASAAPANSIERNQQLIDVARKNPKKVLPHLTDEELRLVQHDLRNLINNMQIDFRAAELYDQGRFGYKIRYVGGISLATVIVLAGAAFIHNGITYKGPGVDDPAAPIFLIATLLSAAAVMVIAGGQVIIWLTPKEANRVQEKIDQLIRLSDAIDARLKKK